MIALLKDGDEMTVQPEALETLTKPDPSEGPGKVNRPLLDLVGRLPRRIGTDIVAISAELHYLRVYARNGEALILMSFGRAVEALVVIPGQAIHRSHWVALAHVVALQSDGDRVTCRLDTGLELPVSRTRRSSLRAALAARDRTLLLGHAQEMTTAAKAGK